MANFNKVILMGNVTRDPQIKNLPNDVTIAEFGIACNRHYRTAQGEDREEVAFVDCTAFGKQAEVIHRYVQKGKPLFVEGRLRYDTWDDKLGGKRSKLSVVVENFQFTGARDGSGSYQGATANAEMKGRSAGWRQKRLFDDDGSRASSRTANHVGDEAKSIRPPAGATSSTELKDSDIPF